LDEWGGIRFLNDKDWHQRRQELQGLGGPPPLESIAVRQHGPIERFDFTPDGRAYVTVGERLRLWDSATGRPFGAPFGQAKSAWLGFAPDGRSAVVKQQDGLAVRWAIPPPWDEPPDSIRFRLKVDTGLELDEYGEVRRLTPQQWAAYRRTLPTGGGHSRE
jgi:hypothetical protein